MLGKAAGIAGQVALTGGIGGTVAAGSRMEQAAAFLARERLGLAKVGAWGGVGTQAASDALSGRLSSPGDYLGSMVGGAAGAASLGSAPPGAVGAITGGTTSLAQDILNGQGPNWNRFGDAVAEGNLLGAPFNLAGRAHAAAKSPVAKGVLGEEISKLRTYLRGDRVEPGPKRRVQLDAGGYTVPDHHTIGGEIVEAKFGTSHRALRGRQAQAYNQPLPSYRVDHWLPADVGGAVEFPFALGAAQYPRRQGQR
jgi:hypothetical protein